MAEFSIKQLAGKITRTPAELLQQFQNAGINVANIDDMVGDKEQRILLTYLQEARSSVEQTKETGRDKIQFKRTRTLNLKGQKTRVQVRSIRSVSKSTQIEEKKKTEEKLPETLPKTEPVSPVSSDPVEKHAVDTVLDTKAEAVQQESKKSKAGKAKKEKKTETLLHMAASEKPGRKSARIHTTKTNAKWAEDKDISSLKRTTYARKNKPHKQLKEKTASKMEHGFEKPTAPVMREVNIPESVMVADLAQQMSIKASEVIKAFIKMGAMVTINQRVDQETAAIIVEEMGHKPKLLKSHVLDEDLLAIPEALMDSAEFRSPIVTIMGHVDHGKTSLLDYIRRAKVASMESGGITQHIGAYLVKTDKGVLTFLDTPGHEAFTAMRARGAKYTDIVVLVVAADDGVMPQTIEAIKHARAASVPMVVAINKIDKPEADPERVKNELAKYDVIPEEWGGNVIFQNISAKTGEGVDALLDNILLQSEVLELKAVIKMDARGVIIESRLDKGRGAIATVLVMTGELHVGDILLAGREYGRVRAMIGADGKMCKIVGPSTPVEVLGLSGTPVAGDLAVVVENERKAREIAQFRQGQYRDVRLAKKQTVQLDQIFEELKEGQHSKLNIVLKADVQGSLEAITETLNKLSIPEVKVNIVYGAVGGITESDVNLAIASQAILIGFNVRADAAARVLVQTEEIDLHYYSVIYNLIDEVKKALSGLLLPKFEEKIVGLAKVREVFRSSKLGAIAGCVVVEGEVRKNLPLRVLRDNIVIYEGELESLRRYKEDVNEVRHGVECGIGVKNYNDIKAGDQIEIFDKVPVERKID